MKFSRVIASAGMVMIMSGAVIAQDKTTEFKPVKIIPPSSRVMVKQASKEAGAKNLANGIKKGVSAKSYGFTTGVSKEKGSYRLGILLADLETSLLAGDKQVSLQSVDTLVQGLSVLGASRSLVIAGINIKATLAAGTDPKAVSAAAMPVIRPFIDEFVTKEGNVPYLKLGEWAESTRLAVLASGKVNLAAEYLNGMNMAAYFLDQLKDKNLPKGVTDALNQLAALEKAKITGAEIKTAIKALNIISEILS